MKSRGYIQLLIAVGAMLFGAVILPQSAWAQTAAGFTVTPAALSFAVNADNPSQTATVTVTNTYDTALQLVAELQGIDETSIRLVPAGPVDGALANAIKLSATDITVPAHGSYELKVLATDGAQLTDGGHYASLVLSERPGTNMASTFRPAVAVSVFVIKNQNIRADLRLLDLDIDRTLFSLPSSAKVTFKNQGNTHVVPRASISLYDGQTIVGKAVINTNSQLLFPGHQADFSASFETYRRIWLPRKLRVQTMWRIDGSDVQLRKEQSFWYVPVIDIIAAIGLVAVLWRWHREIKRGSMRVLASLKPKHRRSSGVTKSTKRMLGRTTLRTHRAATVLAVRAKASKVLGPSALPAAKQVSVQKHIAVKVTDSNAMKPSATAPTKTIQVTEAKPAKVRKAPAKQPKKTTKKATKTPAKKSAPKNIRAISKTAAKKASAKTKKPTAKTSRTKNS